MSATVKVAKGVRADEPTDPRGRNHLNMPHLVVDRSRAHTTRDHVPSSARITRLAGLGARP